jgi:hypothetical protein
MLLFKLCIQEILEKMIIIIVTAVETSNLTKLEKFTFLKIYFYHHSKALH